MDLLIVYEGRGRATHRVAAALADAAAQGGAEVTMAPLGEVTPGDVAAAGALMVGCGVDVRVPFGGERTRRMCDWIDGLPSLQGKPAGVFCTYAFFPVLFADAVARTAETLNQIGMGLEEKGANVLATQAFHRRSSGEGVAELVGTLLQHLDV